MGHGRVVVAILRVEEGARELFMQINLHQEFASHSRYLASLSGLRA